MHVYRPHIGRSWYLVIPWQDMRTLKELCLFKYDMHGNPWTQVSA